MARKGKAEIGITVKVGRIPLAEKQKRKLRMAVKAVVSIMDAHDLETVDLPEGRTRYQRIRN